RTVAGVRTCALPIGTALFCLVGPSVQRIQGLILSLSSFAAGPPLGLAGWGCWGIRRFLAWSSPAPRCRPRGVRPPPPPPLPARAGIPTITVPLKDLGGGTAAAPAIFYDSAFTPIYAAVITYFRAKGIIGVFVAPDPDDIAADGSDNRPAGQTELRLRIIIAEV